MNVNRILDLGQTDLWKCKTTVTEFKFYPWLFHYICQRLYTVKLPRRQRFGTVFKLHLRKNLFQAIRFRRSLKAGCICGVRGAHFIHHFNWGSRNVKNPTSAAATAMLNVCEEGLECTFLAFIVPLSIQMLEDSFLWVKISLVKARECFHICKYNGCVFTAFWVVVYLQD